MSSNQDDYIPPFFILSVAKVVVVGEPGCGKTRFIRQYYDHHSPGEIYSDNGICVYNCLLERPDRHRRVSIFEIPGDPDFPPEQRIPHYEDADIIVFMYAIDDPTSHQKLLQRWLVETINIIMSRELPVVIVGSKRDLQDDQEVIGRLAAENRSPVTLLQNAEMINLLPGNVFAHECSAHELILVELAFHTIFALIQKEYNWLLFKSSQENRAYADQAVLLYSYLSNG